MQAALSLSPPPATRPSPFRLVLWVVYTGIGGGRLRSANFYDPPLEGALCAILEEIGAHPGDLCLMRCDDAREPPCLKGAVALATRQEGRRWPLAYVTAAVGVLDQAALAAAFASLGGRP